MLDKNNNEKMQNCCTHTAFQVFYFFCAFHYSLDAHILCERCSSSYPATCHLYLQADLLVLFTVRLR